MPTELAICLRLMPSIPINDNSRATVLSSQSRKESTNFSPNERWFIVLWVSFKNYMVNLFFRIGFIFFHPRPSLEEQKRNLASCKRSAPLSHSCAQISCPASPPETASWTKRYLPTVERALSSAFFR